ncbi:hypothetical protein BBI17_001272 [Phytophthora kernoviae]|uniref:Uncharacterized protein n=1 Tax=Phytophthora kernoviae TaxID=325452 RepID=A0A3R7G464_9STRA|nr:hypothetical protein BBI17_001272 [Phytophthora kernoviae]
MLSRVAGLLALGVLAPTGAAIVFPSSGLRQVIVLSCHGVRGPYGLGTEAPSEELLKQYVRNPNLDLPLSANAWGTSETEDPTEIVTPKLTKHGFQVVQRMGEYFRDHLYQEFLNATCKETFAYADNNQRDNLTAIAFLSGLYPSCKDLVPITKQTQLLFEQGEDPTANCPVCSKAGAKNEELAWLQWYTEGWHPHQPVPGSMLVFELHSASIADGEITDEGQFYVKLYFVAASPGQIRDGDQLSPENPPDRVQVIIPSCSEEVDIGNGLKDVRCPFKTFKTLISKTLKHVCVADTLRPFVDSLSHIKESSIKTARTTTTELAHAADTSKTNNSKQHAVEFFETLLWALFGVLMLCFITLVIRHAVKRRMERQKYGSIPMKMNNH